MRFWVDFKELREKITFLQLLEYYKIELKGNGPQRVGMCPLPQHAGERPPRSLSVNVEKGLFQCFDCKAKGNLLDFAILMENGDLNDPADLRRVGIKLAQAFSIGGINNYKKGRFKATAAPAPKPPSTPPPVEQAAFGSGSILNPPLGFALGGLDPTHPYLMERGFTPETIETFGLGYCNRGYFGGRIVIPIHNAEGRLVGYAGRIVDDKAISPERPKYLFPGTRKQGSQLVEFKKSHLLYNAHRLGKELDNLIIVEGFASVWWLTQCGYPNVVAIMGSSMSEPQEDIVFAMLSNRGGVFVFCDGDDAGGRCAQAMVKRLALKCAVRVIEAGAGSQPTDRNPEDMELLLGPIR